MDPADLRRALRHDLRSPLAVIVGRADMLLQGLQGPLEPRQEQSVRAILASADRLTQALEALADAVDAGEAPP